MVHDDVDNDGVWMSGWVHKHTCIHAHTHRHFTKVVYITFCSCLLCDIRKWKLPLILFWATGLQGEEFVFYIETQGAKTKENEYGWVVVMVANR